MRLRCAHLEVQHHHVHSHKERVPRHVPVLARGLDSCSDFLLDCLCYVLVGWVLLRLWLILRARPQALHIAAVNDAALPALSYIGLVDLCRSRST